MDTKPSHFEPFDGIDYERPSPGSDAAAIMARRAHELAADGLPRLHPVPCGLQFEGHLLGGGRLVRCIAPLGHEGPHVPLE